MGDISATASPVGSQGSGPNMVQPLCTNVVQLLESQSWQACMDRLSMHLRNSSNDSRMRSGASSAHGGHHAADAAWAASREASQALLIAHVHHHAQQGAWHAVLHGGSVSMGAPTSGGAHGATDTPLVDQALVRRRYRQAAALLHPDKCTLPHAAAAFVLLGRAQEQLLRLCKGGAPEEGGSRPDHAGDHTEHDDTDDNNNPFSWWQPWDEPGAGGAAGGAAQGAPRMQSQPPLHARSTQPSQQDEEPGLWSMPLQELREEVTRRQAAIFAPPAAAASSRQPAATNNNDGEGIAPTAAPSLHERQKRLRHARSVLAKRLTSEPPPRASFDHSGDGGSGSTAPGPSRPGGGSTTGQGSSEPSSAGVDEPQRAFDKYAASGGFSAARDAWSFDEGSEQLRQAGWGTGREADDRNGDSKRRRTGGC